jgi:hypothetical protein
VKSTGGYFSCHRTLFNTGINELLSIILFPISREKKGARTIMTFSPDPIFRQASQEQGVFWPASFFVSSVVIR